MDVWDQEEGQIYHVSMDVLTTNNFKLIRPSAQSNPMCSNFLKIPASFRSPSKSFNTVCLRLFLYAARNI